MAAPQTVWGIDLGRSALKAIRLRASDDKVELIGHEYIEHAKVLTQPDADRPELIRTALEKFLSHNDLTKDDVVVSVAGQHTLARFTKLPPVAPKRIPDIVRYEADQQIPFDMDEVIWDYQTFQEEGGPDLEVGIFAMKRELIREHLLHFEQASIEPVAVQASPLAVYNAALFDGVLAAETTILLDVGAENTDLIIATPDTFWTRTVPIGGNNFTEALVKSFKLSFSKAENLKRNAETSKYARQVFQAMRPVFADLVQELQRSIGYYASTHRDAKVEKVICLGNAFKLPGLQKYLQQNLGLPVEKAELLKKTQVPGGAGGALKQEMLSFACAYGLALQGLDKAKITSNLLPTEIAKQVIWRKKRTVFAAAAACLLLAGGLVWFRYTADMRALAAGDARPPSPSDVQAAWQIINAGPPAGLPDRAQAQAILNAGSLLKREYQNLAGQGDTEREQTRMLIDIQEDKTVVPRLFDIIHRSLPQPAGALAGADTGEQVRTALEGGLPPRKQREQVFINLLHTYFEPDVNAYIWQSVVPVPEPINDPNAVLPAIKMEITCRTPYQGGEGQAYGTAQEFIARTFMESLRKNGRQPDMGFYIDRVYLITGTQIVEPTAGGGIRGPATGGGRGFGRGAPAQPTSSGDGPPAELIDPVTNEPLIGDWEFVVWADVVLEDVPADVAGGE